MVHLQSNDYPVVQSLFSSASASFCKRWHSAGLTHQELRRFAEVGLLASDFRQPHPTISGLTVNPDSLLASSCTLKHPAYPAETFCSLRLDFAGKILESISEVQLSNGTLPLLQNILVANLVRDCVPCWCYVPVE